MTFPIVFLLVGLISWLFVIRIWYKHRKGIPLSRLENALSIMATVFTVGSFILQLVPYLTNYQPIIPVPIGWSVFIISIIVLSVIVIIRYSRRRKITLDSRFIHLTIHYSQRIDTPDTPNPARPRLVVYYEKKKSYWVPTWLEPYIKQHKLNWHTHDGEKALRTWLKKEGIEQNDTDPTFKALDLEDLLKTD